MSQDPVFTSSSQNLVDPQSMNSYSYAKGNPINKKDPSGLATVNGSYNAILKNTAKLLQNYVSFLESAHANPKSTMRAIAGSAGRSAYNAVLNPGGVAYDVADSARNNYNTFRNGTDAQQDAMIGSGVVFIGEMIASRGLGRVGGVIPDEAIVVRGGSPSNFAPGRFKIGESRSPGVIGWSAQCATGACAQSLASNLPNLTVGQTTAGAIRAAGGDVIKTDGPGEHVTVTGLDGFASSNLSWDFFKNLSPWQK